jgi:hypothetical protein
MPLCEKKMSPAIAECTYTGSTMQGHKLSASDSPSLLGEAFSRFPGEDCGWKLAGTAYWSSLLG